MPMPLKDLTGQTFGLWLVLGRADVDSAAHAYWHCICECGRAVIVNGGRLRRGNSLGCVECRGGRKERRSDPTYAGMHSILRQDLGRAADRDCVECGAPAKHWAYQHTDPAEVSEKGIAYSLGTKHYAPMCVPCHKAFDLNLLKEPTHA